MAFKKNPPKKTGFRALFVLLPAVLALSACEAPKRSADYRVNNPIKVEIETVSLVLTPPAAGRAWSFEEEKGLAAFAEDYLRRGQGPIAIKVGGEEGSALTAQRMRDALLGEGILNKEMAFERSETLSGSSVLMKFSAARSIVPKCGQWESGATYNWSNRIHGNFGCSTQRNIGLTVADPMDLKKARTMSGKAPRHTNREIYNYNYPDVNASGTRGIAPPSPGGSAAAPGGVPATTPVAAPTIPASP